MKLAEFFIDLTVDAERGELTVGNLLKSMGQLEVATLGEVGALLELAQGFASLMEHSIDLAQGLTTISQTTGINVEHLQQWKQVADEAGWSGERLSESAQGISEQLYNLRHGLGSSLTPLGNFISLMDVKPSDPFEVIRRIRASKDLMSLPNEELGPLIRKTLGDASWMSVLRMKASDLKGAMSDAYVMPDSSRETFSSIEKHFKILEAASTRLRGDIAQWAAPELLRDLDLAVTATKSIDAFFERHKGLIASTMEVLKDSMKLVLSGATVLPGSPDRARFADYLVNLKENADRQRGDLAVGGAATTVAERTAPANISVTHKTEVNLNGAVTPDAVREAERVFRRRDEQMRDDLAQQLRRELQ